MDSDFVSRLKQAMADRGMRPVDLSKASGIDKAVISCYISGRYRPNGKNAVLLSKALGVSEAWLMGFDMPPEREIQAATAAIERGVFSVPPISRDDVPKEAYEVSAEPPDENDFLDMLPDDALELLEIYQGLTLKGKTKLLAFAYEMEEKEGLKNE